MVNIEIKARTDKAAELEQFLLDSGAEFVGMDEQTDTYYKVAEGRLKLREGNIENSLIFYKRENQKEAKASFFELARIPGNTGIDQVLSKALTTLVVVKKRRKIYYLDNLKLHIDHLEGLGDFVEIEARDMGGQFSETELRDHCDVAMKKLGILSEQLISHSYSDMLLEKKN